MKLFCSHKYQEYKTIKTPPLKDGVEGRFPVHLVQKILYGSTEIINKCEKCGKMNVIKVTGVQE